MDEAAWLLRLFEKKFGVKYEYFLVTGKNREKFYYTLILEAMKIITIFSLQRVIKC